MTGGGTDRDYWSVLASRRMCRAFESDPIPDPLLARVLEAAFRGPAAGNTAAVDLVVLGGSEITDYWQVTLKPAVRERFPWPKLLCAPTLVIPVVDPNAYVERYARPDKERTGLGSEISAWPVPYWFVDGGAAVMAMLLAAEDLGLGALFFGQFEHESAVSRRFAIPEGHRALGTIALGYPAPGGRAPSASARNGRSRRAGAIHRSSW